MIQAIIWTNQRDVDPLKYRLPKQPQTDTHIRQLRTSELAAWLAAHPIINMPSTAALILKLLQDYNRCEMPAAVRLKTAVSLQPVINKLVEQLRVYHQNESLPLRKSTRTQANKVAHFLRETAFAYKTVVTDSVIDNESYKISINLFIVALRLTIAQPGQPLLEYYSQYGPTPVDQQHPAGRELGLIPASSAWQLKSPDNSHQI